VSIRTVSRRLASFSVLLAALISPHLAGAAALGPITMSVPDGFIAAPPMRQEKMSIWAWTKSAAGGTVKALLEVTVYDFGPKLAQASPEELASGSEQYLRQFLGGVERRRTNYALSPVKHVTLAGAPASTATWTGRTGPADLVGVMYCVIVQNRYVVAFHTQDLGSKPTPAMREAIAAIEAAQLVSAPPSAPAPTAPKSPQPEPAAG
jgi:hypothetical protein